MISYVSKNGEGKLVGFYPEIPENNTPCQIIEARLIPSSVLSYDENEGEPFWLYEISFADGVTLWVNSFDMPNAVVSAMLAHGTDLPRVILEYDLFELRSEGVASPVAHTLDGAALEVLASLTFDNRDLVAHSLNYVNGYTAEELVAEEQQRIELSLRVNGIERKNTLATELTADEIRKVCSHVWHSYIFFESTDASLDVHNLMADHAKSTDPLEALFWSYVFELWGHYDCVLPYSIYRAITEGLLDRYLPDLDASRSCL